MEESLRLKVDDAKELLESTLLLEFALLFTGDGVSELTNGRLLPNNFILAMAEWMESMSIVFDFVEAVAVVSIKPKSLELSIFSSPPGPSSVGILNVTLLDK